MSEKNYKNDDEPTDDYEVKASVKRKVYVRKQKKDVVNTKSKRLTLQYMHSKW